MSDEMANTSERPARRTGLEAGGSDLPSAHGERTSIVPLLQARNLRVVRAGATILDIPELTVRAGEVLSLIGPNGAGKTTLLQSLCHLHKHFEGEVLFKDRVIGKDYEIYDYRRQVAMVFQEPLLFDTTVFKNVASGLKFRGVNRKDIERRVVENLEALRY